MPLFKTIHTLRFDTMDSTHTWGKKNIHLLDPEALTCILATEQTQGYGRKHRKWHSPPGVNIYTTLCFTLPHASTYIGNLGQILCLAAASVLESKGFVPEIKWPNDVRVQGKKIAGVLCDTQIVQEKVAVVLSIGLNINMPQEALDPIDQPATSLLQLSGRLWDLNEMSTALVHAFVRDLTLLDAEGFAFFHDKYEELLIFKGKSIYFSDGKTTIEGICQGIAIDGRLELLLPNGEKRLFSSGEIALHS